jgi:transposase
MLIPESQVRIWLYGPPTDMRKSFDGLSALVRMKL